VVEKSGAWYAYSGEKIGQGRDNSREFLRENPDLRFEIENKVRTELGVPLLAGDEKSTGAKSGKGGKAEKVDKADKTAAATAE
jgi:recombination protein RecA